jgi:hypothetical protein
MLHHGFHDSQPDADFVPPMVLRGMTWVVSDLLQMFLNLPVVRRQATEGDLAFNGHALPS